LAFEEQEVNRAHGGHHVGDEDQHGADLQRIERCVDDRRAAESDGRDFREGVF
jgi:hypothetical protein